MPEFWTWCLVCKVISRFNVSTRLLNIVLFGCGSPRWASSNRRRCSDDGGKGSNHVKSDGANSTDHLSCWGAMAVSIRRVHSYKSTSCTIRNDCHREAMYSGPLAPRPLNYRPGKPSKKKPSKGAPAQPPPTPARRGSRTPPPSCPHPRGTGWPEPPEPPGGPSRPPRPRSRS